MTDRIGLRGLRVVACHGVLEHEKTLPQPFLADVVLEVDLRAAGGSDRLERTVSYADVAQDVHAVLAGPPVDLVETLAERIAAAVLQRPAVEAVEVTIRKPHAPAGVDFAGGEEGGPWVQVRREADRPVVIALGANLGRREQTLAAAVRALRETDGLSVVAVSDLVETDPVGGPEQPDYLNAVVVGRTRLAPWTLLARLHEIESWHRREREVRWGARTLDLDLIQVGTPGVDEVVCDDEALRLPHPRAAQRAFVLRPWVQADPAARLRVGEQVRDAAQVLSQIDATGVRPGPVWEVW